MPKIKSLMNLVDRILLGLEDGTLGAGFEEPIERGSATGSISVIEDPEHLESLVVVRLSLMKVPASAAGFYERLLELNHASLGRAAFSIDAEGVVFLTAGRPVADLDPDELIDLILWTAEYADDLDDKLLAEFGSEYAL